MVTIKFKDGTTITAEVNANSYIVDEKPTIPDDLSIVTIIDEDNNETILKYAKFFECAKLPDDTRYCFGFIEMSDTERQIFELQMAVAELAEEV